MEYNNQLNGVYQINQQRERYISMGESHSMTALDTPLKVNAFVESDEEKMAIIERHVAGIMDTLGLDLEDDSLKGTPHRIAKMYVKEIFSGLNPLNKPNITLFENSYKYNEMLIEKNISLSSTCEHHFVPIIGKAHVAYISNGKVIGLSKINRLVQYFAKRPQVQERLTMQIGDELKKVLHTEHVAVIIEANHMCVSSRGVEDLSSSTTTVYYAGKFKNEYVKAEFLKLLD